VSTLGVAMLLPALVDLAADNDDWMIFASSAMVTMLFGFGLFIANRGAPKGSVDTAGDADDGDLVAGAGGVRRFAVSLVGHRAELHRCVLRIDVGPDHHRRDGDHRARHRPAGPAVLARAAAMAGRLGIIVMAIAVLPMLQIGGMQLFKAEAFDTAEKILPRATQISTSITLVFIGITGVCAIAYMAVGHGCG
jgi:trk system potassium uptake protein TrkH